jgi:hypothetical protein
MKWIEKIIEVKPFSVKVLWNDGNIRNIDFKNYLKNKSQDTESSYNQLLDYKIFSRVKCDGTTLFWENLIQYIDIDGVQKSGNLDISPELLYELAFQEYKQAI